MLELVYWHWIVFGAALLLLELALPTFTALWFGAAAIIVGGLLFLFPTLPVTAQVLLWAGLSVLLTWLWFKYIKPRSIDRTLAGLSREAVVGKLGTVLTPPGDGRKGLLRFTVPVLGADEWQFVCEDTLMPGDRVRVVDVLGNALLVTKD